MTPALSTILSEIVTERARQDELHPWDKLEICTIRPQDKDEWREAESWYKRRNNKMEAKGCAFVFDLLSEELCESASETDPVKQETEAIQLAALAIKFVEWSRAKRKENKDADV